MMDYRFFNEVQTDFQKRLSNRNKSGTPAIHQVALFFESWSRKTKFLLCSPL